MPAVIEVQGLHKKYRDNVAVDDVSLSVADGEIFGILGRNGAGKTTTVECIEGLRRPDRGERSRLIRLMIPFILLVIYGSIPSYTQGRASLGGHSLFDAYLPILIGYALGMVALTGLATVLAGYRE